MKATEEQMKKSEKKGYGAAEVGVLLLRDMPAKSQHRSVIAAAEQYVLC